MLRVLLPAALLLLPGAALAHTGAAAAGFASGASHPLSGADHLLAMVALGLLAAQTGGRALWALPVTFVGAMILGGLAGAGGLPFPAVEPVILASVIVLSVLVALAWRPALPVLLAMTALFGAAHGWAHGAEGPQTGIIAYAAGFAVMTMGLHLAGILLGRAIPAVALRAAGAVAAASGALLAAGV